MSYYSWRNSGAKKLILKGHQLSWTLKTLRLHIVLFMMNYDDEYSDSSSSTNLSRRQNSNIHCLPHPCGPRQEPIFTTTRTPIDFVLPKRLRASWQGRLHFSRRCRNLEFTITKQRRNRLLPKERRHSWNTPPFALSGVAIAMFMRRLYPTLWWWQRRTLIKGRGWRQVTSRSSAEITASGIYSGSTSIILLPPPPLLQLSLLLLRLPLLLLLPFFSTFTNILLLLLPLLLLQHQLLSIPVLLK